MTPATDGVHAPPSHLLCLTHPPANPVNTPPCCSSQSTGGWCLLVLAYTCCMPRPAVLGQHASASMQHAGRGCILFVFMFVLCSLTCLCAMAHMSAHGLPTAGKFRRRSGRLAGTLTCACQEARSIGASRCPLRRLLPNQCISGCACAAARTYVHTHANLNGARTCRFSILNSLLIVLVMASLVALILIRTVRRDLVRSVCS